MINPAATIRPQRLALESAMREHFARDVEVCTRAPGRVDLMGSHTDYNEGFVLTATLDRELWMAGARRTDRQIRVVSLGFGEQAMYSLDGDAERPATRWMHYIVGVVRELERRGHAAGGFDAVIDSTIPIASGLSSSAALEAATAMLVHHLYAAPATLAQDATGRLDLVRVCLAAEQQYVGVNCGILDQYTVLMGQAGSVILIDCRAVKHELAPFPPGLAIVICDTRSPRELSTSQYGVRRAQCRQVVEALAKARPEIRALRDVTLEDLKDLGSQVDAAAVRRAQFIIEENARVQAIAKALRHDDRARIGDCCHASFAGARDLYEIVNEPMRAMHDAMTQAPGVVGARQAGAGFGGCMVAIVREAQVELFVEAVQRAYLRRSGLKAQFHRVVPSDGAGAVE